ncbi:MAG: hypothetical protein BZ135_07050 [Methanosphaera sp. rholeuAM6]|nr:MAG: hypothetical protein BZ135_07050 [Methanosphaera sp. rholeuAM6]
MKNTKIVFSILIIFFILISISSISATSDNNTQDTFSDSSAIVKNDLNTKNVKQESTSTHILNTSSFDEYVTDGKFNDKVSEGDTIDIQGKLDNPRFALNITKPLNIISSTENAYIDLDTHSLGTSGDYTNGMFQISEGSAGTNITGIVFHNTRVWVDNTFDVHVDNITVLCEQNTGSGVGSFSIRGNSHDITVTNSYFKTIHNGGHSNVVVAGASNCLLENNTVITDGTEGNVGNVFYLTTYGGSTNTNITIRNNTIRSIFPDGKGLAICMGLVLEGSDHIIENNYINAIRAVGPQWADASYGVVTDLDNITFRNNYVIGGAKLNFNGLFYNNTIDSATFSYNKAYNNSIENVTINDNVIFENNTAKKVIVDGENNTLNNNEISSDEDYAVTITGDNNTLLNNQLSCANGVGNDAISNSTEVISYNNSGSIPNKTYYLNENNMGDYFMDISAMTGMPSYAFNSGVFNSGDRLVINLINKDYPMVLYEMSPNTVDGIIIENTTDYNLVPMILSSITLVNSHLTNPVQGNVLITLINSTITTAQNIQKDENSYVLYDYPIEDTYVLTSLKQVLLDNNGHVLSSVKDGSEVMFYEFNSNYSNFLTMMGSSSAYINNIFIDRKINLIAIGGYSNIESNILFDHGSEDTNITGALFTGDITFETGYINFINCTFNKDLTVNQSHISFDGCTFNAKVTLNSTINTLFNNCLFNSSDVINVFNTRNLVFENNTVTTSAVNTIVFDDESNNNIVKNNYLVANSLVGDDSVVIGDNIVEDNSPGYDTQIIIDCDSQVLFDEFLEVTITVNDLNNSNPVSKGYVEVYYDGYLIDIKDLVNGVTYVEIPVAEYDDGSDSYSIKVWYYDGIRYANNVSSINVEVVKSNVTIDVNEFTAKMNEEATITATFLNQKGNPVQATNVTFTVGRLSYTTETASGVATINELVTSEWLDAGKITVTFPDTDAYNRNTSTFTLNTSKADILITPKVTVEGSTASINLALTDELNNNVTDGKVTITTIDGIQLASGRVNNGVYTATVTIPDNYESEYLVANYTGSFYYNDLARNVKLSLMLNSTITLETNDPVYGEELVITGKLEDSKGNTIGDANVTVNINGNKVFVSTDSKGEYTYTYTPSLGLNTITATFNGNDDVYGTSITKEITIRDTDHDMNDVLNQLDEITKANEQLQEQLALQNEILAQLMNIISDLQQQNNNLSDKLDQQAQANDELSQQLNDTTNALTQQNNELKEQLQETTNNLTGQIDELNDKVNNLTQANSDLAQQLNDTTNNLTDQNNELKEQLNNLTQANEELSQQLENTTNALTEQNNELKEQLNNLTQANDEISQLLENTTNALTEQNNNLKDQLANQSQQIAELEGKISQLEEILENLTASEQTTISISPVVDAQFNDEVTITGVLSTTKGNSLSNQVVTVSVNGNSVNVTTVNGVFEYRTVVKNIGDNNNITVSYEGTDKYNPSSANTTFTVDKADCIITIDDVTTVKYGENVTITGTFTNGAGKAIANSKVKLQLNGVYAYVKTDKNGVFTWTTAANRAGENTIVASYGGSSYYNSYKTNATFNVEKQDLMITADDVSYSDGALTIKGTFKNVLGKAVKNTNVRISLNGKTYYAKTDENGTFLFTQAIVANKITYVLGYGGSATYNAYTGTKTTLTVA